MERMGDPLMAGSSAGGGVTEETPSFLVVDDEPVNAMLLQMILSARGFRVITASSGEEALARFAEDRVDMVLMDIMMPGMDGYETTRRIRAVDRERFVPVLFVTALTDEQRLAQCIEAGGDDFITKPISRVQLNAKIDSWLRTQALYRTVTAQRDALDAHQRRLEMEQETARRIVERASGSNALEVPGLRYCYSPADILSGDILLAARRPNGNLMIFLGDFTGHGIGAAVGVPSLATLFHDLTRRGSHPGEMLDEINTRLFAVLPPEMFLATAVVEVDFAHGKLGVWNAGMPPVVLVQDGEVVRRYDSSDLPLGVVRDQAPGRRQLEYSDLLPGSVLYACSDGVVEAAAPDGALFGSDGLERAVLERGDDDLFGDVLGALDRFRGGAAQRDDITLFELDLDRLRAEGNETGIGRADGARWQAQLILDATTVVRVNPLPAIMNFFAELGALEAHRQRLYVVVSELYTNALEHGVLGLDSTLKKDPDGFEEYYRLRAEAMERLKEGQIRLTVSHDPDGDRNGYGAVVVEVEDSGGGFDYQRYMEANDPGALPHPLAAGHGIVLVRSLCREVVYHHPGNRVTAVYEFHS